MIAGRSSPGFGSRGWCGDVDAGADAVLVDLLKEEQHQIADEMAQAQRQLDATDGAWNVVETNLTLALGLVSDYQQASRRGGPRVRRRYDQAFWEAIYVDDDGVSYARLAEPFSQVLSGEIKNKVEETQNPAQYGTGRGLGENDCVDLWGRLSNPGEAIVTLPDQGWSVPTQHPGAVVGRL